MAVNATKKTDAAENNTTKVEVKEAETKTATPVKEVAKKEEKEAPAKSATKKTTKKSAKKGAKRGPKPASERTVELYVQYGEKEVTYTDLVTRVKDMWKEQGKRETSLKSLNIYVKPEESKAYYVINEKITGELDF